MWYGHGSFSRRISIVAQLTCFDLSANRAVRVQAGMEFGALIHETGFLMYRYIRQCWSDISNSSPNVKAQGWHFREEKDCNAWSYQLLGVYKNPTLAAFIAHRPLSDHLKKTSTKNKNFSWVVAHPSLCTSVPEEPLLDQPYFRSFVSISEQHKLAWLCCWVHARALLYSTRPNGPKGSKLWS